MRFTHPSNGNGGRPPVAPNSTGGGGGKWGGMGVHSSTGSNNNNNQQQQQQQQAGPSFSLPSLLVVYDSPSSNKLKCSPVFDVDVEGTPRVTNKGR